MRDNIKPIEAGFFKFCMKNLSHGGGCVRHWEFRDGLAMENIMDMYCEKYSMPSKTIDHIIMHWEVKDIIGIAPNLHDRFFNFDKFPPEYIALIPRRIMCRCPVFAHIVMQDTTGIWKYYKAAFAFKTIMNGRDDVDAIYRPNCKYWQWSEYDEPSWNKYKDAINILLNYNLENIDKEYLRCIFRWIDNKIWPIYDSAFKLYGKHVEWDSVLNALERFYEFSKKDALYYMPDDVRKLINHIIHMKEQNK